MPIVSTVQVTSFVQFDGDQTTAVHTRTVVEISEDGDVIIEDSAEIDNATNAVCVRQSAQVDTDCSQMLLHSETQQDRPEFDPKAAPSDVTVEQCSDLVEDEQTKEARTHVSISPGGKTTHDDGVRAAAETGGPRSEGEQPDRHRTSTVDDSSLTQVSDLDRSFEEEPTRPDGDDARTSADAKTQSPKPLSTLPSSEGTPVEIVVQAEQKHDQRADAPGQDQPNGASKFNVDDAKATDYEGKSKQDLKSKDVKEHEVDATRSNLPEVGERLGGVRKKPEDIPKIPTQTTVSPLDEEDPEGVVEQVHGLNVEKKYKGPAPLLASDDIEMSEDDRLTPESIRRRSLTQLGARPKFSTLDLLTEDMSGVNLATRRTSLELASTSSTRRASLDTQERALESRKVSFDVEPKDTAARRSEAKSRPSKERRPVILPPQENSDNEETRPSSRDPVFSRSTEDVSRKTKASPLRKQLRPSLGLRAKVRRSSRNLEEELPPSPSTRAVRAASKPKRTSAETSESPPSSRKSVSKKALQS